MICSICSGDLCLLGDLGGMRWLTCRGCGMQCCQPVPSEENA